MENEKEFNPVEFLENQNQYEDFDLFEDSVKENEPEISEKTFDFAEDDASNNNSSQDSQNPFLPDGLEKLDLKKNKFPSATITKKSGASESDYFKLKDYISKRNFKLIGDISFWYDTLEFVIEGNKKWKNSSALDIKKFLENDGFTVDASEKRDFDRMSAFSPVLRETKKYNRKKVYFFIRVSVNSDFFDEDYEVELDETSSSINEHRIKIRLFPIAVVMSVMIAVILAAFSEASTRSDKEVLSKSDKAVRYEKLDLDLEKLICKPETYDLVFETTTGTKKFYNASYEKKWLSIYVTSYDADLLPVQYDEFSRLAVKTISKKVRK